MNGQRAGKQTEKASPPLPPDDPRNAVSTYRYLRIAIIAVMLTLVVSLALEKSHATCWNGSISAYYYTPVHSVLVAALAVIGVALISIRGGSSGEEMLLNAAGFLAPVVAFVPTGWSSADCPSNLTSATKSSVNQLLAGNHFFSKFSGNNLVAFVAGGLAAVIIAEVAARLRGKQSGLIKELTLPALADAALVAAGFVWHAAWPASFNTHAHESAAIIMFVFFGSVIVLTAGRERPATTLRRLYYTLAGVMVAGVLVVGVAAWLVGTWNHKVLVLEAIELTAFTVFWFVQTIELWDKVPPPWIASSRGAKPT